MSKTARRAAGDHSVYQRKSDGRWCAALTLPDGPDGKRRRKVLTARTREQVVTKLRDARRDLDRTGNLPTSSPTLNQWLTYWLKEISAERVRPGTQKNRASDVRLHIAPSIGKVRLERLSADHVRKMHTDITDKGNSPTTALRCHRVLSVALRDAMRSGRVSRNVATSDYVDAPAAAISKATVFTQDQAVNLLQAAAKRTDGARWAFSLLTGARLGEVLGLEWDRVHLEGEPRTELAWQLQRLTWAHGCAGKCRYKRAGSCPDRRIEAPADFELRQAAGGLHLTRPKTRQGWRTVPLAGPLLAVMQRHHQNTGEPIEGLVFTTPDGGPIDPDDDYQTWLELLREAGVPRVRRHDARHTAATLLLVLGQDRHVVQQILGHSSALMTQQYQQVNLTMAREAMGALGDYLVPQMEG